MTRFPTPGDYVEALQLPEDAFTDPDLARGSIRTNALGLPRVITGAYAVVFRVTTPSGDRAVRLFHTDDPGRRRTYRAVSRFLDEAGWDFVIPVEYQHEGIEVGGHRWPLVKMPWVEGRSLATWLENNLQRPERLNHVANRWKEICSKMEQAGMAHGDLQHDNILIDDDHAPPRIALVDYDGAFVPGMRRGRGTEIGHRNFQHPDRTPRDHGPGIDRFAALMIYTALRALTLRPELWERFSTGENVLFSAEDFFDPHESELFGELGRMEEIAPLVSAMRTACLAPLNAVPTIDDALAGEGVEITRRRSRGGGARKQAFERWALPAAVGIVVLSTILGVALAPEVGFILAAVGFLVWIGWGYTQYRRSPEIRRRARLRQEAAVLDHWIEDLENGRRALAERRTGVVERSNDLMARRLKELRDEAQHEILKHHFIGALSDDPEVGHRAVIRLKRAGIRTAFHLVPEMLDNARGVEPSQRARAERWRQELLEAANASIPRELDRVEVRRIEHVVERQVAEVAAEEARLVQKIRLQQQERERIETQLDQLPPTGFGRYLARAIRKT